MGVPNPDHDVDTREGEETGCIDVVIEEEYKEELDYEDNVPTEEQSADVSRYKAKCPSIWKQLGEPVNGHTSTDTETGETATLMGERPRAPEPLRNP